MREMPHSYEYSRERRRGKWRFDDDEPLFQKRQGPARALPSLESIDETDGLPEGTAGRPGTSRTPWPADRALPGLAGHRAGRGQHRARHPQDR